MSVNISAKQVNELRQKTGSGMMDCKKALIESNGDFEKAIDILRKKGKKVSASRSDRKTSEGIVIYKLNENDSKGMILSFTCETDFVAKNQEFIDLAINVINIASSNQALTIQDILDLKLNSLTVKENILELVGKIGEKIEISDYKVLLGEKIVPYIHAGNKLGVLVSLSNTSSVDYVSAGKDVAMQIAAMNPLALNKNQVDQSVIDKEIEIGREQALKEGKPENIVEKIAEGKLKKFFKDNTLLSQNFVKDNSLTVKTYLATYSSALTVDGFLRVSIG